ncbi:hypothetical protein JNB71_14285 [Rhizobium herbae]|uniref:Glycosyltransferase family 1 protein n=1 Tax=Rhizobium herbae TaxID=508661 RepID=A0ABS7HBG1_9HYPH|nr:hypothetical protein [Rhizobium herbae]MBW9064493.1 hypothetical protein [Rhizobium herbae]
MKICVIVPSENYLSQAGARIRYTRMTAALAAAGHSLTLLPIENFKKIEHEVYLLSKCFDAAALVVAQTVATSGKIIGVDLFDDYFSEQKDSRFQRLRGWLIGCLACADFVLCSTPVMQRVAAQYAPGLPVHVMNDPFGRYDIRTQRQHLARKHAALWANGVLNVAWYGMGDNPYFPVGLADLAAFADELADLQGRGFDVHLNILTNRRAMTGDALAALRAIPVPYEIHEWDEAEEQKLLAQTHVVFLPVSAQNFSVAKSLNRAVTALCSGNQVLSAGFPLYKPFADFIYRDAAKLVSDLKAGRPRVRAETLMPLDLLLRTHADPAVEARGLGSFLETIVHGKIAPSVLSPGPSIALIHGVESSSSAHKFAKRMGALSIASPLTPLKVNFDLRFDWNEQRTGLDLLVSEDAGKLLAPTTAAKAVPYGKVVDFEYRKIGQEDFPFLVCRGRELVDSGSSAGKLAAYSSVMSTIRQAMEELFPDVSCVFSENWRLPWPISSARLGAH